MRPAPMPFSVEAYIIWALGTLLLGVCLALLGRRRLHRRLPVFTAYIAAVFLADLIAWWAYHRLPRGSLEVFYLHWSIEAVLISLRAFVVAEICRRVLLPYRGVWALARILLLAIAGMLLGIAAVSAWGIAHWLTGFILTAKRGVELYAVGMLATLALVCRFYEIPIRRLEAMLAMGLGLYSAIEVVNATLMRQWLESFFPFWSAITTGSYLLALGIWLVALARPEPAPATTPGRLSAAEYGQLSPAVNERLRALNARLEEMLRG